MNIDWRAVAFLSIGMTVGMTFQSACGGGSSPADTAASTLSSTLTTPAYATPGGDGDAVDPAAFAEVVTQVAAMELAIADAQLELTRYACFRDHMLDDQEWAARDLDDPDSPGFWRDIEWDAGGTGAGRWDQGPNSDAMRAFEDCWP